MAMGMEAVVGCGLSPGSPVRKQRVMHSGQVLSLLHFNAIQDAAHVMLPSTFRVDYSTSINTFKKPHSHAGAVSLVALEQVKLKFSVNHQTRSRTQAGTLVRKSIPGSSRR